MRQITGAIFAIALFAFSGHTASASVLTFDDAWNVVGDGGDVTTYYNALGVTIVGDNAGVWGGNSNGNPGGWSLQGTNGAAFLGCNDGDSCSPMFGFANPVDNVSLDIGLANNWSATFTVAGFLNNTLVDSETLTITHGASGGTWDTFTLNGAVDVVAVSSSFVSPGFAFGLDNVQFESAPAAPEPASFSMLLLGAAGLGIGAYRRRRQN